VLIPSIDLKNGRVVQLVQGEKLALADDDLDAWIARFSTFPKVQLIDLDAAMGLGHNDALVRKVAAALPVRVGGGVRTVGRAEDLLAAGAHAVIVSSSWFNARAPGGSNQPPPRLRRSAEALRAMAEDPPLRPNLATRSKEKLLTGAKVDPLLEPLRDAPRYFHLLWRMNLPVP